MADQKEWNKKLVGRKLMREKAASRARKNKLKFESIVATEIHKNVEKEQEDNVGVEATHRTEEAAEAVSNPLSKWRQKAAIKKEYAKARAAGSGAAAGKGAASGTGKSAAKGSKEAAKEAKTITEKLVMWISEHPMLCLMGLLTGGLLAILAGSLSSCGAMFPGGTTSMLGTTYTAEDEDIRCADSDYDVYEQLLRGNIDNIESTYTGYDEYRYNLNEINHNKHVLAAYLTVKYENYTREQVQEELQNLYNKQYKLELEDVMEVRYRTETHTDSDGNSYSEEVPYYYYILYVTLKNNGLESVIAEADLTDAQRERYNVLLQTQGNKGYLFEDDIYSNAVQEVPEYEIPGEALTDQKFAAMMQEAEKYLGYPYVWGGASPATSFDCSGFVSYVVNHCGNGWNFGRLTANGLKGKCRIIQKSQAKPGDLIFFQGTYNTSGASHVGIYVGDGMMIHCGNPIQYASTETNYWKQHFYCFGRLP